MKMNPWEFVWLVLVIGIPSLYFFWWLPQKWDACFTLYDNLPAQIICLY